MAPEVAVARHGRPVDPGAAGARLGALFEAHGRMVYGVCRLLLRDSVEAEDAAQQAFLSAYRSLLGGTEPRDPAAWLATIARNECRTRIRERMRQPLPLEEEPGGMAESAEAVAGRRADVADLAAALGELPEKQREAIILRDVYGFRYGEVCAALGLSLPAVESLLFRARRRLQVRLKPVAATVVIVPLALRDSLAQAIPSFAASSAAGGGGASVVAGVLGKMGSAPLAAKVAAVSAAVTTAGGVTALEVQRLQPSADETSVSALVAPAPVRSPAPPARDEAKVFEAAGNAASRPPAPVADDDEREEDEQRDDEADERDDEADERQAHAARAEDDEDDDEELSEPEVEIEDEPDDEIEEPEPVDEEGAADEEEAEGEDAGEESD